VPDPAPFDQSRAAAFEERLVGALNSGALCLMTSVGHRVGLFDAMADLPAAGSEAIAAHSGLNERYVREWLGAMVAGGVVDYDPRDGTYALPREHAAFLTRAATPANLAVFAQYISSTQYGRRRRRGMLPRGRRRSLRPVRSLP
jgi:winged helix-turn-helix protein